MNLKRLTSMLLLTVILLFTVTAVFPAETVSAAPAGSGIYKVTTTSGLNVRSGPSASNARVGGINYGATFTVTQTSGEWGYVPSYNGWVSLDYAQIQSSASSSVKNPGVYKVTASSGLNVRSGPNASNARVGGINYGATFTVTQISSEWGYVPSYNGWVSLDYAQYVGETPAIVNPPANFTPRTTAPAANNKYYIKSGYTVDGVQGVNDAILGNASGGRTYGSVLPNCVGFAVGRAFEITGKRPTLSLNNANTFWSRTSDGYSRGQTPKVGAVICWNHGSSGHVAIVEKVYSNGNVDLSESHWGGSKFVYRMNVNPKTLYNNFQGFIYVIN